MPPTISKFGGSRGNTREHVVRFLDFTGAHANDVDLCLRELSKLLTDHAYAWYVKLKLGTVHNWEHLVSLFNTKIFHIEAKFTLAELWWICQHLGRI